MTRDVALNGIWLLGALVLVGSGFVARRRMIGDDRKLLRWALLWVGIFVIAGAIAAYFT